MHRALLTFAVLAVAALAEAAPVISHVAPPVGFTFGGTRVTIHGTGFTAGGGLTCPQFPPSGNGPGTCPIKVFFGGVEGWVYGATATTIDVAALPSATGQPREPGTVDVRVVVEGQGEATLANGFRFDRRAEPGPNNFTPVLVPLTSNGLSGAHGSIWFSELSIFNASAAEMVLPGPWAVPISAPIDAPWVVDPLRTDSPPLAQRPGYEGAFVYVPNPLVQAAKMSLRVRDTSENATSWGAEVPVVRREHVGGGVLLMDIPTDPRYRGTLRIYGWTAAPMRVRVSVYAEHDSRLIEEYETDLRGIVTAEFDPMPRFPAYAAINPLTTVVRAADLKVRIAISNMGEVVSPPPPPIWAFVSITSNESQQVTVVTPK